MAEETNDVAQLRSLAAKCRRLAGNMTDEDGIAVLRQLAAEYESKASRLERQFDVPPIDL